MVWRLLFKQNAWQRSGQRANGSIFPNPPLREDIKEQHNRNQCTTVLPARKTDHKKCLNVIFIVVLKVLFLSINSFGMLITGLYHSCNVCSDNSVLELNTTVFGLEMEPFAATTLVDLLWH